MLWPQHFCHPVKIEPRSRCSCLRMFYVMSMVGSLTLSARPTELEPLPAPSAPHSLLPPRSTSQHGSTALGGQSQQGPHPQKAQRCGRRGAAWTVGRKLAYTASALRQEAGGLAHLSWEMGALGCSHFPPLCTAPGLLTSVHAH